MTNIPEIEAAARLIVKAAAYHADAALCGFRLALLQVELEFETDLKNRAIAAGYEVATASDVVAEFGRQIWPLILVRLDEIKSNESEDFPVPLRVWQREAAKIGRALGEKLAVHGGMEDTLGRPAVADMHREVRKKAKMLTDGWPLSKEVRVAANRLMLAAADEGVMSFLSGVCPPAATQN